MSKLFKNRNKRKRREKRKKRTRNIEIKKINLISDGGVTRQSTGYTTILNRTLLIFYVLLVIAAPMIIFLAGFETITVDFYKYKVLKGLGYIFLLVVSAPIYAFYAYLMIKRHFPVNNLRALLLFVPVFIAILFYFFSDSMSLFEKLISDSLPLYLGLNILFFIGLLILFVQNLKGADDIIARLIAIPIVLFILFFPVCYMMIVGYQLSIKYSQTDSDKLLDLLKFFISIVVVIVFHYKTVIKMYDDGAL